MTIGEAIRTLRKQAGLSQQSLARLAEVSGQYLCTLEKNKADPSVGVVTRLAEGIGVPVSYIFWFANERSPEELANSKHIFEFAQYLLTEIQTLNRRANYGKN